MGAKLVLAYSSFHYPPVPDLKHNELNLPFVLHLCLGGCPPVLSDSRKAATGDLPQESESGEFVEKEAKKKGT